MGIVSYLRLLGGMRRSRGRVRASDGGGVFFVVWIFGIVWLFSLVWLFLSSQKYSSSIYTAIIKKAFVTYNEYLSPSG